MRALSADAAVVHPAAGAAGRVRVPGDKSVSHRYALLAALADGASTITGYSPGADCASTLGCLEALGVRIARPDTPHTVVIEGRGVRGLIRPDGALDAANSGTTMRLLTGILAAHPFPSRIEGDASLTRRPMRRVIEPLSAMGARIDADHGRPPLVIHGGDLRGIDYCTDVPSAQVKSAILLAGLQATGGTSVTEPAATRDHTERALRAFGAVIGRDGLRVSIEGGQRLRGRDLRVPGDISSATFWMVLAAGTPGGSIDIDGVGLNPSRTAILDIIRRAGAHVSVALLDEEAGEPVGRISVRYATPRSFVIEPAEVPGVIDEIPALAALAAMMPEGTSVMVSGAAELRVKESDRIRMLAEGFRAMGSHVEEFEDGFTLASRPLSGGVVDAAGDHRLAMAFGLAATRAAAPTTIRGASSASVSYPEFFDELGRLVA